MEFETVKFGENGKSLLAPYKEVSDYASTLTPTEHMLFSSFDLIWFKEQEETVGYAIVGKVTKEVFQEHDDGEEIIEGIEEMEENKQYIYVPYYEIFTPYQNKGLGSRYLEKLKQQLTGETIIVYTTDDSYDFWYNNGFEPAYYSQWWLALTA